MLGKDRTHHAFERKSENIGENPDAFHAKFSVVLSDGKRLSAPSCSASLTVSGSLIFLLSGKVIVTAAPKSDVKPYTSMGKYSPK